MALISVAVTDDKIELKAPGKQPLHLPKDIPVTNDNVIEVG